MLSLGYDFFFKYTPILYNHIRGWLRNCEMYIIEMCSALNPTYFWYSDGILTKLVTMKICLRGSKILFPVRRNKNEPSFYSKVACTFLKYYMEAIISGVREMFVYDVKSYSL